MKNTKRKLIGQTKFVKTSSTGSNITKYTGLIKVTNHMNLPQFMIFYTEVKLN